MAITSLKNYVRYGDDDPDDLYHAMGKFTSTWEFLEVALAMLYAEFIKQPNFSGYQQYGSAKIFKERLAVLCRAANSHFIAHPNQILEGEFDWLVSDITDLSVARNNIAHGVVATMPNPFIDRGYVPKALAAPLWVLIPPFYASGHFARQFVPAYIYNARRVYALRRVCLGRVEIVGNFRGKIRENGQKSPYD